jgi:hypothetical protein
VDDSGEVAADLAAAEGFDISDDVPAHAGASVGAGGEDDEVYAECDPINNPAANNNDAEDADENYEVPASLLAASGGMDGLVDADVSRADGSATNGLASSSEPTAAHNSGSDDEGSDSDDYEKPVRAPVLTLVLDQGEDLEEESEELPPPPPARTQYVMLEPDTPTLGEVGGGDATPHSQSTKSTKSNSSVGSNGSAGGGPAVVPYVEAVGKEPAEEYEEYVDEDREAVLLSGWFKKKADTTLGKSQLRWFEMNQDEIRYFAKRDERTKKGKQDTMKGVIGLLKQTSAVVKNVNECQLRILQPTRTWKLLPARCSGLYHGFCHQSWALP